MYRSKSMQPFGLLLNNQDSARLVTDIPVAELVEMLNEHKAVVMRGFSLLPQEDFIAYARKFGPLLKWEFGEVLDLRIEKKPPNHLFGSGRVEMHWDGAYLTEVPRFSVFQCLEAFADEDGGETLFTDTSKLLDLASPEERERWSRMAINYSTDKAAHYSGAVTVPLVGTHPYTGEKTVRFIEPYNEDNMDVNPVNVDIVGLNTSFQEIFLRDFTSKLYSTNCMYRHRWQKGDFLIYDNNALLHGRSKIKGNIERHLQRIHILDGKAFEESRTPNFIGRKKTDVHA